MDTLYKVLENGISCHGGDLQWSLPKLNSDGSYTPGDWHEVEGPVVMCSNGLHLTTDPWGRWMTWNGTVYEAEGAGESRREGDKVAFERARLLRPTPVPQWWTDVHEFVESLENIPFFQPDGKPDPSWELFIAPTWQEARERAAWEASWHATRESAKIAARDSGYTIAQKAARSSADAAAWDAVWAVAQNIARDAARSAAYAAAWDATQQAARSAILGAGAWAAARADALKAARSAAETTALNAALDIAMAATLWARMIICDDLIEPRHREYAQARWQAIKKGYGVVCDVKGRLYVYAVKE